MNELCGSDGSYLEKSLAAANQKPVKLTWGLRWFTSCDLVTCDIIALAPPPKLLRNFRPQIPRLGGGVEGVTTAGSGLLQGKLPV